MQAREDLVDAGAMTDRYGREELANAISHGIGVVASLIGGSILIVLAALGGRPSMAVGVVIFAASLLVLYSASTLYHAARAEHIRRRLQVLDHCAIYILIAGTYTPFMIGTVRGGWGWSLFGVIWGLAVGGVLFKLFFTGRFPRVSTAIYLLMGWLALLAIGPLVRTLEPEALAWLVAGGIAYTGGTIFYHSNRIPYAHAVWHAFVLTGSLCHGIAIALQL
ncbi:MAG TPA: hemolysin III family protein [Longimicrobiales bacterium]